MTVVTARVWCLCGHPPYDKYKLCSGSVATLRTLHYDEHGRLVVPARRRINTVLSYCGRRVVSYTVLKHLCKIISQK